MNLGELKDDENKENKESDEDDVKIAVFMTTTTT
jgi:hypothetical protein